MNTVSGTSTSTRMQLGELLELKYGKSLAAGNRSGSGYAVYGSNGIVGCHEEAFTAGPTIVVGRKGSYGQVNYSSDKCWPIDTTYYVDATCTEADLAWLKHLLPTLGLDQMNKSAAVPGLNREDAYRVAVQVPRVEEQRRIAAILDKADELRAKRCQALAHLDTLTQSIFHEMFESAPAVRLSLRDATLRFVSGRNLVGSGANIHPRNKVLKVNAVSSGIFDKTQHKPLPANYEPPAEHLVRVGDLIVTRASGTKDLIGVATRVGSVQPDTYLPDKLWKAVTDPSILNPTFFQSLTQSERYRAFVANSSSGAAGVSNISQAKLLAFTFDLPPLELQQAFATRVAAVERLKEAHRKHLAHLDILFASLQHRAFNEEL